MPDASESLYDAASKNAVPANGADQLIKNCSLLVQAEPLVPDDAVEHGHDDGDHGQV
jgi:hypothetical protein